MIEVIVATIARIRPRTQAAIGGQFWPGVDTSGAAAATLWVLTTNQRARHFYERHGWAADGAEKTVWRGDVLRDPLSDLTESVNAEAL